MGDKAILEKLTDSGWMNPSWLDEIKEEFSEVTGKDIDAIYFQRLKEKINVLSRKVLLYILKEQGDMASDQQNALLQKLIEEKLKVNQEK